MELEQQSYQHLTTHNNMKTPQQTADELKKTISARSTALNQYNADIEDRKQMLADIQKLIKESEQEQLKAEDKELKAQALLAKTESQIKDAQDKLDKAVQKLEAKMNEIDNIDLIIKEKLRDRADVEEKMNIKYEAMNNRYTAVKHAIRREMDKVRDILK